MLSWKCGPVNIAEDFLGRHMTKLNHANDAVGISSLFVTFHLDLWRSFKIQKRLLYQNGLSTIRWEVKKGCTKLYNIISCSEKSKRPTSMHLVNLVVGVVLLMSVSVTTSTGPACKFKFRSDLNRASVHLIRCLV